MSKINFLVFEKSFLFRKGLVSLIREIENSENIIEYSDVEQFHSQLKINKPNIVIINMELFSSISPKVISRIKTEFNCHFIGICHKPEPVNDEIIEACLFYDEQKTELLKKISPLIDDIINNQGNKKIQSIKKTDHELSDREKDVVALVGKGLTNKEIADNLFISIHTVMTHRKNIVKKLGIKTVSGITVYAILNKLIDMKDLK
jgi:DNA-binding NarL/FixJ family response regulator